jgi:carbon storage regulator CsrA
VLVLTRRINEKVVLPSLGVTVQVLSVRHGVVRLGVEAPAEVKVFRAELLSKPPPAAGVPGPGGRGGPGPPPA